MRSRYVYITKRYNKIIGVHTVLREAVYDYKLMNGTGFSDGYTLERYQDGLQTEEPHRYSDPEIFSGET